MARGATGRRRGAAIAWAAMAAAAAVAVGPVRAVAPNFTLTAPAGAQRGTTVEVTLRGERLADTQEIFFYDRGIELAEIVSATERAVKVKLRIAPDCRLGEHALRLRTASGISALRLFFVGPFATVEEKENNNERAKAQPVALDRTVEGTIAAEDTDWFAVEAKAGQRISLEIEGARLGRTMFDPIISLHDATGRALATSDDTPLLGHDAHLSCVVPADGTYAVQVRDRVYSGAGHAYRLHVGEFPRPATALPLGGPAGAVLETKFLGDPLGEIAQRVTLPAEGYGTFAALAERGATAASPNGLRVVPFPNAAVSAGGATLAAATPVEAPVPFALNGVLAKKGEAAFYKFKAKKGQNLEFAVFARRFGSPLDSVLTVYGPKGNQLGTNDDAAGHPDSSVRVRIAEDGDHTVKIADQLGRGGPLHTYRIEIAEARPQLVLSIPDTARYDYETRKSLAVPRGNRFAVLLNINRDLCNEDLRVAFDGLPAGITARAETVPGSLSAVPVVFEATEDAAIAGDLLTPSAVPVDAAKAAGVTSRYRHGVDWVRIQNDTVYVRSEVNKIAAAVVEAVPFKVRIVEPKVPLVQSGEMLVRVEAERAEGFDEPITLKMLWNPPGVSSATDLVIPKGATKGDYKLNTTAKAETRGWKIAIVAAATVQGGLAHVSTQLAPLEVAPAFLGGKIALTKIERGQPAKVVCALEQLVPFDGEAEARLVGLPDNVTAEPVKITKESKTAEFAVTTNDKSPAGTHKNVAVRVTVVRDGEPMVHQIAVGSVLRIDAPKAKPVAMKETQPTATAALAK